MKSFDEWFDENCDGSDLAKDACRKLWDEFSDQINIICRKSYEKQQSKVDELKLQVAEMKSRLNDAYTAGQSAMYAARQSKVDELQCEVKRINLWYSNVKLQLENKEIDSAIDAKKIDELQRRNKMLIDNIKEQGQKLVYQNEVIETQSEKLLGLRDEKAELQKRLDAVKQLIEEYRDPPTEDKTFQHALSIVACELEQALKGGSDESN